MPSLRNEKQAKKWIAFKIERLRRTYFYRKRKITTIPSKSDNISSQCGCFINRSSIVNIGFFSFVKIKSWLVLQMSKTNKKKSDIWRTKYIQWGREMFPKITRIDSACRSTANREKTTLVVYVFISYLRNDFEKS